METYNGHVRTPGDAIILFEACRIGLLPRVQRRLSEKERQSIKSGSVFVWDEREAGMRRWTDGKSWSASRVSGSFLTYREMEGKRGGSQFDKNANRDGMQNNNPPEADSDGGPDGYRYKPDGLMKQSFSIVTNNGQHLHLISYYSRSSQQSAGLMQPTSDPQLRHIRPEKGMYPESTVHEQSTIPAVTRGPMSSPGYTHSPHPSAAYARGAYGYPPHPNAWAPPSPMHTPPPHPHYGGYYQHPGHPGYGHPLGMQYPPHGQYPSHMNAFDRPPPHLQNPALPPPPHHYGHMPPHAASYGAPYGQPYPNGYGSYQPPPIQTPSYPPPSQQPAPFNARPAPPPAAPLPETNAAPKDDRHDSQQSQLKSPAQSDSEAQAQAGAAQASTTQAAAPASTQPSNSTTAAPPSSTAPTPAPAAAPANSGQTIPSIHTMLSSADGNPPVRSSSRSPNGTLRIPSDIPSHKLGFEANRDMQALRNLDKTTFKAY